ncbi:MAG: heparan-alpha-glucosaminide N-acetyltransferase domain-containing protein [Anaerolineales bacterium]
MAEECPRISPKWRAASGGRLLSVDALRGLMIVLMALDHANYLVALRHRSGEYWGGYFPVYDDPLAFVNRFVTHLCAPGFFFLMGAGMLLFAESRREKGWSRWQILRHFWIRGAVLIGLQFLVVNRIWEATPLSFPEIYVGVLVALGGTMILGGLFVRLMPVYLMLLSLALFIGMELAHPDPSLWGTKFNTPLGLIFAYSGGQNGFWVNFSILPWLELVTFGMLFGHWLRKDRSAAIRRGLILGIVFLLSFVILREADGFGNIRPRAGDDWIAYLNVVKYPPSITFTVLTMGLNLVLLWLISKVERRFRVWLEPLVVYGRVPLFSYVVHLLLYLAIGKLLTPNGSSVPSVYPYWLLGLAILLPLAWWFGNWKRHQPAQSPLRFI